MSLEARHAEQPRLLVDQLLDGARVHLELVHQVEHDAGIERAAARAHRQAVDGGEAHRADCCARCIAHMLAVAEVRDDHASLAERLRANSANTLAMYS